MMAFALLESLVVTGVLVLVSVILPARWLRDGFALKGFIFLSVSTAAAIVFQKLLPDNYPAVWMLWASLLLPLLLIVFLILLTRSRPRLENIMMNIQDRLMVMLFIYVPIGLLSLVIVLVRNLL